MARIHSGDPSIYGAINEQMRLLDEFGIAYEVIPGISSFQAASAAPLPGIDLPGVLPDNHPYASGRQYPYSEKEALEEVIKTRPTTRAVSFDIKASRNRRDPETAYLVSTPVAVVL